MNTTPTTRDKVADLLNDGKTVLEISYELRISPQMVYRHRDAIRKTGKDQS